MFRGSKLLRALTGTYVVALACVAMWRTPIDRPAEGSIATVLEGIHRLGAPLWVDYGFVEASSNIALFVPFGVLAMLHLRGNALAVVVLGFAVSTSIEVFQAALSPQRFATVADVFANTSGAMIGVLAVSLVGLTVQADRSRIRS